MVKNGQKVVLNHGRLFSLVTKVKQCRIDCIPTQRIGCTRVANRPKMIAEEQKMVAIHCLSACQGLP